MRRVLCLIRPALEYRREIFRTGLEKVGFKWFDHADHPTPDDLLVIWNRYGAADVMANAYEARGARVLVVENGYMGRKLHGQEWFAMSEHHHNGAGTWRVGGPERWDSFGIELAPWREGGSEIVLLPQRGIGPPGVAMPNGWANKAARRTGACRIRPHPGEKGSAIPLEQDLARAKSVVTWGSGAALKALQLGIPVHHDMPNWIGAPAASPWGAPEFRGDRLPCFSRLAWAMWRDTEIESGESFAWILNL